MLGYYFLPIEAKIQQYVMERLSGQFDATKMYTLQRCLHIVVHFLMKRLIKRIIAGKERLYLDSSRRGLRCY